MAYKRSISTGHIPEGVFLVGSWAQCVHSSYAFRELPEYELRVSLVVSASQDMYDELMMTIGSRRSGLNQNLTLKSQYERALQDLADLLETGQEKMAGDQKIIVSSKEEIQQLLDKHKVHNKKE